MGVGAVVVGHRKCTGMEVVGKNNAGTIYGVSLMKYGVKILRGSGVCHGNCVCSS